MLVKLLILIFLNNVQQRLLSFILLLNVHLDIIAEQVISNLQLDWFWMNTGLAVGLCLAITLEHI